MKSELYSDKYLKLPMLMRTTLGLWIFSVQAFINMSGFS